MPFFKEVLEASPTIRLLLGNGKTVVKQLEHIFGTRFEQRVERSLGTSVFCGKLLGRQFIGWSQFLSNSRMNRSQRAELARLIGEMARSG